MNSSSHPQPVPNPSERSGGTDVSRSGRVRKKNTLLAEYESVPPPEKPKKKSEKGQKDQNSSAHPKVTLKLGTTANDPSRSKKKDFGKMKNSSKNSKNSKNKVPKGKNDLPPRPSHFGSFEPLMLAAQEVGDLEMDLPPDFDSDMPILAAEEIIDESLLDAEDSMEEIPEHSAINRLKSQAQSTYMMEKTMEKNRKVTTTGSSNGTKTKAARKDKGSPRVTAYMLWAKDQRAIFAKKYPNLDFSTLSKKLSDLWATVPQNQKKMWKNKAGKIMRKSANVNDNIKNSAPPPPKFGKGKKPRGRPRIHPVDDEDEMAPPLNTAAKSAALPIRKSPQAGKAVSRKPGGNFLSSSEKSSKSSTNPSPKSSWQNQSTAKPKPSKSSKGRNSSGGSKGKRNSDGNKSSLASTSPSTSFSFLKPLPPRKDDDLAQKVTGTAPIDVAAHFALLGESLTVIGERLKDVEGQTVSGSLSVLLDSLLCATGPLLCLSQQVPELNCIPQEKLAHLLDTIAYVMPGL